jgi:hypothetical protein
LPLNASRRWLTLFIEIEWPGLYAELLPILERARAHRNKAAEKQRRIKRRAHMGKVLRCNGANLPGLSAISDFLGMPLVPTTILRTMDWRFAMGSPRPLLTDALKWPVLDQLLQSDISNEVLEVRFSELKGEIDAASMSWVAQVEQDLIDMLKGAHSRQEAVLKVRALSIPGY